MENQTLTKPIDTPPIETPVTNTPAPTLPIEKPKPKISISAIIGIILFLLVAGGAAAGYTYREPLMKLVSKPTPTPTVSISPTPTPTPDPTANWITFEGDGFLFKYPPDFSKENCLSFHILDDFLCTVEQGKSGDSLYYTLSQSNVKELPKVQGSNSKINYKEETINGNKTFRTTDLISANGADTVFVAKKDGTYITLSFSPYDKNNQYLTNQGKYHDYFEQILSTIKFTENSADYQLLMEQQDAKTRNTLVEFSNANIRYYVTHAGFPWSTNGPCQSSATAAPQGKSLNQMIPCISLPTEEGELKGSFLSANGQSIANIFVNSHESNLNICYKPSSIKEQVKPETIYDVYGQVDKSCSVTDSRCYWCTN